MSATLTAQAPLASSSHPKQCVAIKVVACGTQREMRALVSFQGVDLCALVRVEPHASHRWVDVTWDYAERVTASVLDTTNPIDSMGRGESPLDEELSEARTEAMHGAIGSSMKSLDGANEPIRPKPTGFKMQDLKGGTYVVVARIYQDDSRRRLCGVARTTVEIR